MVSRWIMWSILETLSQERAIRNTDILKIFALL